MNKIYIAAFTGKCIIKTDVVSYAYAEDGEKVGVHQSSNIWFAKHDIGYKDCDWHHDDYAKKYPDGFELIWIDCPETDPRWLEVIELNKKRRKK